MAARILEVILKATDNASAVLEKAEGKVTETTTRISGVLKGLAVGAAGLAAAKFFKDSVVAAMEAERSVSLLAAALKPLGINYDNVRDKTEAYLTQLQRTTRFGDDEYRDTLRNMVLITGDFNKSLAMLPTVAGLAIAQQRDLASAGEGVAKAMNGNLREFQRLFPEIKLTGDAAEFLRGKFEALALEDGKTLESRLIQLRNAWDDLKESVGMAILGTDSAEESVERLTETVIRMQEAVDRNKVSIGEITDAVGWFAQKVADIGTTVALGWLGIVQVVRAAIGQLIGWTAVALESIMTPLRAFGVDAGRETLATVKATGLALQEEARASIGRLHGVEIAAELTLVEAHNNIMRQRNAARGEANAAALAAQKEHEAAQAAQQKNATKEREERAKEAEKQRQREADAHAKELLKIAEDIAVKQLQYEEGLTEKQAQEVVRRKGILKENLGVIVTDAKEGFVKLNEYQLLLAARFDNDVVPSVKNTVRELKPLKVTFAEELPGAIQLTQDEIDALLENMRRGLLREELQRFGDLADTFLTAAGNLGIMDDKTRQVGQSMAALVQSVGSLSLGDPNAWLSVVQNLAGVLGQIFGGESPEEKARKELIRKNNEALRDLIASNGELARLNSPGRVISGAGAAIRGLLADPTRLNRPRGGVRPEELLAALTQQGVSLKELDELAESLKINFRTGPRGEITAGGLQTFLNALGGLDSAFPKTLTGALERITKGVRLGAIGESDQLRQVLAAVGEQGPNAIMGALTGLNLNTAEGRQSGVGALRDLFTAFARGDITAGNLGGMTGEEFLQALDSLITLLQDDTQVLAKNRDPFGRGFLEPFDRRFPFDGPNPWGDPTEVGMALGDLTVSFEDIGLKQVDYLSSIDANITGLLEQWTDIDTGLIAGRLAAPVNVGGITVNVTGATDPTATADAVQRAVSDALNQALADSYLDRQLATGNVTRTVS